MRRIGLFCCLVWLISLSVFAHSITLVKPEGGKDYIKDIKTPIMWTYTGFSDADTVKISLLSGNTELEIADNIPIHAKNTPSGYGGLPGLWPAGVHKTGSAPIGCNYKIRIRVNSSSAQDDSDSSFCLKAPVAFQLTAPKGGETWSLGSKQKITWNCPGCNNELQIRLFKGTFNWGPIAKVKASAGSYEWKVGEMPPPTHTFVAGSDYTIAIEPTAAGTLPKQVSKPFSITEMRQFVELGNQNLGKAADRLADKWIKVINPTANTTVKRLEQVAVQWQCSDFMKKQYAKVSLRRSDGTWVRDLLKKVPLQISHYSCQLWTQDPAGDCIIRIEALDWPGVQADSGVFHVVSWESLSTPFYVPETNNSYKWTSYKNSGLFGEGGEFSAAGHPEGWPNPGSGNIRVGYKNECSGGNGICYAYRSWIFFDLQGNKDTEVISAEFNYTEDPGVPTPVRLYRLTQKWDGTYQALFSNAGLIQVNPLDLRSVVQEWMKNPAKNYGLVMTGANENFACNKSGAVHILYNVKLKVREKVIN